MKLLAIETSSEACSAALYIDGDIQQEYIVAPRRHGELILTMIDKLMSEASLRVNQLDGIAYGRGPGSFIGVRIASGVTQGLAFAADLPVIPVSSLAVIAQNTKCENVVVAVDARMGEVYWAAMTRLSETGVFSPLEGELLAKPDNIQLPGADSLHWVGAGTGWEVYGDQLKAKTNVTEISAISLPDAAGVATIAKSLVEQHATVSAVEAQPFYVRDKVASKPGNPAQN